MKQDKVETHYGFIRVPLKEDIATVYRQICEQLIREGVLFIDCEDLYNEIEYAWMVEGARIRK